MDRQEIHKFYRGKAPPNAWEGQKLYGKSSSTTPIKKLHEIKKKIKPIKNRVIPGTPDPNRPKTPQKRYYA